ncbi:hypothetical protein ACP4OV_012033 [Aristida adscensionis]
MVAPGGAVSTHTVHVAGDAVHTMVTSHGDVVRRWVSATWLRLRRCAAAGEERVVGMGVQWTPLRRAPPAGAEPPPATLQLCAGNRCLVFQVAQAGAVPAVLRRFMADGGVTFAGYNVGGDCRKLHAHHGLVVASTLELRGAWGMGGASMERMAEWLLGVAGVGKSPEVGTSRWGVRRLSRKQVRYACADAYLSCRLGARILAGDRASLIVSDDGGGDAASLIVSDEAVATPTAKAMATAAMSIDL